MPHPIDESRADKIYQVTNLFTQLFPGQEFVLIMGADDPDGHPTAASNMTLSSMGHALMDLLENLPLDELKAQVPPEQRQ